MSGSIGRRLRPLLGMPSATLEDHAATHEALIELVLDAAFSTDDRLFLAQVIAQHAWFSHPGLFADARLERAIGDLGVAPPPEPVAHATGRVLHVLTQGLPTGGHTRLARRWIEEDAGRQHSVALTRQSVTDTPLDLRAAVGSRGGTVFDLSTHAWSLRGRATALRTLAAGYEFIVLHTHPYDVLPVLAFADWPARPRVLYVNHADHVFWLGASVADVVVCLRGSGARLATARRRISPNRITVLPIPIPIPAPPPRPEPRDRIRARLGLAPDDVVIVSIAADYKFRPMGDLDYPATAAAIVEADPRARIRVVGPTQPAIWTDALRRSRGRLVVGGPNPAVGDLLVAGDIFLDSLPMASLTSLLEAGRAGLPLVAPHEHPPDAEVLAADGPGIDGVAIHPSTPSETVEAVVSLVRDRAARVALGERTARAIAQTNGGQAWREDLERAYEATTRSPERMEPVSTGPTSLDARLVSLHPGFGGLSRALSTQLPLAAAGTRFELAVATLGAQPRLAAQAAIPDVLRRRLQSMR